MKLKKLLTVVVASATVLITLAAPIQAQAATTCSDWYRTGLTRDECDQNSGWCYWNTPNEKSLFTYFDIRRQCVNNNLTAWYEYSTEKVKTGCC